MIAFVLGCLLLLSSASAVFRISFTKSTYYGKVATLEDPIGKVVITADLTYNETLLDKFITKDFSLYRSDGSYFSVDKDGNVKLKKNLPSRRLYTFQISLLYTASLASGGTPMSGFLTSNARIQGIGPVHFDNSSYGISVFTNLPVGTEVYNFNQHVVYNQSAFKSVYYEFDYVFSSYFSVDASTGRLYLRRALYPGVFSVRVEIEYDVTLKNGTVFSDDEYVYASIKAVGCNKAEEIKAYWPQTHPCSGYRISCTAFDSYFSGGFATRICGDEGGWLTPDFTSCRVQEGVGSFALVWMTFSTSSGSYVISQLSRITNDIEDLFPSNSISNIVLVSGFRSNVQYGFMAGFRMNVNTLLLSESSIRIAKLRLGVAYRFGSIYLRRTTTTEGRGLRVFNETAAQCNTQELAYNDPSYLQVCSGSNCNCSSNTNDNVTTCDEVEIQDVEVDNPTGSTQNKSDPSYLSLNATDYYGRVSAFAGVGTYVLTAGYNISGNSVARISHYHYDISGFYSDYFKIGRTTGHLTVNRALTGRVYSFDVSFFYSVTYTNGSVGHNYTESDVSITALAGVGFNASQYFITVDVNYTINETVLTTMQDFLTYDNIFVPENVVFTRISDTRFSIDPVTGDITISQRLDPLRVHYGRVYISYNGTVNATNKYFSSSTSVLVRIYTSGCFELENGNVVWPATHVCNTVAHKCQDVDRAFNPIGTVTRYCSRNGTWFDADYSQCSLKPGTSPFVHLYLTFYTGSSSHILNNLQNIIRSAGGLLSTLSVTSLIPYSIKESVVRYGMVVVLRGEVLPNDTILTNINATIDRSRTFARIRLQTIGNGIVGFKASSNCEYPDHPSRALVVSNFTAICQTGDGVTCDCPVINPSVGVCSSNVRPTTVVPTATTASQTSTSVPSPSITPTPVVPTIVPVPTVVPALGLQVSAATVDNSSVELQWSDNNSDISYFKVSYSAIVSYNTSDGPHTYVINGQITTNRTSYKFKPLNPSTEYTFSVTSYTKDGPSSTKVIRQSTDAGRMENPSFVELHFISMRSCDDWDKEGSLVKAVVAALADKISTYCKCPYTADYIEVWSVRCQRNSTTSDIVITGRLIPTDLKESSYMMNAMSDWIASSGLPVISIGGETLKIDQSCDVQIEHPYGADCTEKQTSATGNTGAVTGGNSGGNNDDDDEDSSAAIVGGVIAGLVIICITIVVLVVVVMLLRKREKRQIAKDSNTELPTGSSYNADTMKVKLADEF